jgi:aspartyl/asparaginyl-tRNA synthetase
VDPIPQAMFETDYFGEPAFLAQTGQLYVETACPAFRKVYCFGPTFRAEKSKTRRHLTEFWMLEPEVAFADSDDNMDLHEDLVCYLVERTLERCSREFAVLERDTRKPRGTTTVRVLGMPIKVAGPQFAGSVAPRETRKSTTSSYPSARAALTAVCPCAFAASTPTPNSTATMTASNVAASISA